MAGRVSLDEAIALVLEHAVPLPAETVPLDEAIGRVLVHDAVAAIDLPPFASSAMDGYAVRASGTPGRLRVTARVAAGVPATVEVGSGEAAEISTGGVVPGGADAVVPVERVVVTGGEVEILESVRPGDNIRSQGSDVRRGEIVVGAGCLVTPARIGALAAAGVARLACGRRPRVAIVTTGTELRDPGADLAPGEIYESNGRMLEAVLRDEGALVERLGVVADDPDSHRAVLERALAADLVVSTGGVSVGPHDLVRRALAALGVVEVFWGIAVRPGKPVSFGTRGGTLVFGLPGNPVASLVGALLLAAPAVRAAQGHAQPAAIPLRGTLAEGIGRNPARDELVRARVRRADGVVVLEPILGQESHMIVRASRAEAIARIRQGEGECVAGTAVDYYPL